MNRLPWWIDYLILPLISLILALVAGGMVILVIGENPFRAMWAMLAGAFNSADAIGYTLYYATNFIFTGLAVAIAFHAGLFNIGGEGQANLGGMGAGLLALFFAAWLPAPLVVVIAMMGGMVFAAVWGAIPGLLQAYRGSHIVITTIMFNFIAATLMVYLLSYVLIAPGQMAPQSEHLAEDVNFIYLLPLLGLRGTIAPLNSMFIIALVVAVLMFLVIYRTAFGYEVRVLGQNVHAAHYAGVRSKRMITMVMAIAGALAGLAGVHEVIGVQQRITLEYVAGAGFTGIAVALMGRNHPLAIIAAAIFFGALQQGGANLAFDFPSVSKEMVVVIQGLVVLFSGALAYMFTPLAIRLLGHFSHTASKE